MQKTVHVYNLLSLDIFIHSCYLTTIKVNKAQPSSPKVASVYLFCFSFCLLVCLGDASLRREVFSCDDQWYTLQKNWDKQPKTNKHFRIQMFLPIF